jgi:transposase InsO family protein
MVRRVLKRAEPVKDTASALGVSARTVHKWVRRYRLEGEAGLMDRSSRPGGCPHRTQPQLVRRIERLRRHRLTAWQISRRLGVPRSTVSRWLARAGMGRLRDLEPRPVFVRYERKRPGALLHLDTKKLARIVKPGHRIHGDRSRSVEGAGWEHAHVAVDDHSRVAYTEVLPTEDQHTCTGFLQRAVEFFASHGITVRRVMTDNGPGYISRRFNRLCGQLQIRHLYTRPYTPRTNGKAERFIRTLKEQWAYGACYQTSAHRTRALQPWTNHYNRHRPHAGIGMATPISRLEVSP